MSTIIVGQLYESKQPLSRIPTQGLTYQEETIVMDYGFADVAPTITIPASPSQPVYIIEVLSLVRTALAGGTATVTLGDGTTADLYATSAQVVPATAGTVWRSVKGAKLTANGLVVATLGASNTSGALTVFVRLFRVGTLPNI